MNHTNKQILDLVDAKIQDVETAFQQINKLVDQTSVFRDRVNFAAGAEYRALHNYNLSEEEAVNAMSTAHAIKEVTAARLANAESEIASQKRSVVSGVGQQARKYGTEVAQQLHNHRLSVAIALVEETFEGQPLGSPEHLARHSKRVVEATQLASGVSAHTDDDNEVDSLRHLRSDWAPVAAACENEDGLVLTLPESWFPAAKPTKPTTLDLAKEAQLAGKLTADQSLLLTALAKEPEPGHAAHVDSTSSRQ